jgi:CubicO group peptidase (beta-lactamase class C family)
MHQRLVTVYGLALCLLGWLGASAGPARAADPVPPFEWRTATPDSQGLSREKLDALRENLARKNTKALLIIRNEAIAYEWYAPGHGRDRKHYTASLAKAIVGSLAVAVLLSDGRVALDDRAARYIPQWKDDPKKSQITLRHLGSHTSGLEDAEAMGLPHDKLPGWKGDFWKRLAVPNDPFTIARDRVPLVFEPGKQFQYSNPGIALLAHATTAALKDAPQKDIRTLLRDRVMRSIGVADDEWSAGYGQTFTVHGLPLVPTWGGGSYTARATARVGRLMLRGGDWDGKPLLSKEAVRLTTTDAGTPGHCGIAWWTNTQNKYPRLPRDAFWGSGVPSLNLIAVRNGENLEPGADHHDALVKHLFVPLLEAVTRPSPGRGARPPYPPSPVIACIDWEPKERIIRQAKDSDNWPLTWADDDALYAAYGDGRGFDPKVPEKLGLGFARILGSPPEFRGVNIRSRAENRGTGAAGKKASGLLMVDGVLYLWLRNAGNSQLAWSSDRGQTWVEAGWKFTTSFGCPTFLNFGKNYAGARDDHVYVYSHDAGSAYEVADRMVLARVPAGRIRERDAYEFFQGLTKDGVPRWTGKIEDRGAVFTHTGRCYRSGITCNAGLKRYLWCQTLPGGDARFQGGFGVYDAPEPWGPWTTVYFTEQWDVGPGESSSFPAKWMSKDGKTLYLVFSGDDSFSVRKAVLVVK